MTRNLEEQKKEYTVNFRIPELLILYFAKF